MIKLRDYQQDILTQITSEKSNDLVQLDTGAGKTPILAAVAKSAEKCLLVAHRNILITQISEKLAEFGIYHDTLSSEYTRRQCMAKHAKYDKNYIERGNIEKIACSIDSLISRYKRKRLILDVNFPWIILIDEAHHVVSENKWGKLRSIFKNARIIGFTATPARTDGESLHVSHGGLFDRLVQAENLKSNSMCKLIENGFLSNFTIYAPEPNNLKLKRERTIMEVAGDPVKSYKRFANNKRAIVMCQSILNSIELSRKFIEAGIQSGCINSSMSQNNISRVLNLFFNSEIRVLCNVDMVGEGFDVPGIEALIMMRKTSSFIAYRQWIGRALRASSGKENAVIIDHVGNVAEHGMPHEHVEWDIINPPKGICRAKYAPCNKCGLYYKIDQARCPECKYENVLHKTNFIGGYYIEIKNLDIALVEKSKVEIAKIINNEKMETEIIIPTIHHQFREIIKKLQYWVAEILKNNGVSIIKINKFLNSEMAKDGKFWVSNFTVNDEKLNNFKKAIKVFEKCQKLL